LAPLGPRPERGGEPGSRVPRAGSSAVSDVAQGAGLRRSYNERHGDIDMGLTFVEGVVSGPASVSRVVRFLVDSGAKFSLLPPDDGRAIGLTPRRRLTFVLADGTEIERDVSECYVRLAQGEGHTPTREILGLVLHPFNRTLQPARLLMA